MNRKAFLIAKEIVESEQTFIKVLRLLNEVCFKSPPTSYNNTLFSWITVLVLLL